MLPRSRATSSGGDLRIDSLDSPAWTERILDVTPDDNPATAATWAREGQRLAVAIGPASLFGGALGLRLVGDAPDRARWLVIDAMFLNRILRSPAQVAEQCRSDRDVASIARTALVTLAVAAMAFGAAVGSWRGGKQIAFAALKMPIAILGTLAIAAPAFYVLAAIFGRPWALRPVLALLLSAGARFALVLLALTPPLWLTIDFGAPYDVIKLAATLAYGLAGLAGLEVIVRGLGDGAGKRMTILLFVGVFMLIGAQSAWVLRPYLGSPGDPDVALFTRAREGGLVVQLVKSVRGLGR